VQGGNAAPQRMSETQAPRRLPLRCGAHPRRPGAPNSLGQPVEGRLGAPAWVGRYTHWAPGRLSTVKSVAEQGA
jgi:hypothetical protein